MIRDSGAEAEIDCHSEMLLMVGLLSSRPISIGQDSGCCSGSSAMGVATLAYHLNWIRQSLTV